MRTLITLIILFNISLAFSQVNPQKQPPTQKQVMPSKNEIQSQMNEAINDLKKEIAEKEKMIGEAKKNKEDQETIESLEDDLKQLKEQLLMIEKTGKSVGSIPASLLNDASNETSSTGIPARKSALLNALPKENLNQTQLQTFLNNLYADLKKKISSERVADVQKIIALLENDAASIAGSGVAAWYNNAPAQAALLVTYAATKSQDPNTLNNCGAIMNLCSHEEKAIPILKYVLASHPDNSTVLNNLGQAYAGLGDKQTAMMYFARCIQQSPNHPEANATAAKIEESNGNTQKAMEYTEASLRGAYSEERAEYYDNNKKSCKINVLFDTKRFGKTEFFDPGSLQIPPNCRDWASSESVYPYQVDFNNKIDAISKKYEGIVSANRLTEQDIINSGISPFNEAALFKKKVIGDCYTQRKYELYEKLLEDERKLVAQEQVERKQLDDDCEKKSLACGKNMECKDKVSYECCQKRVAMDNKYFSLWADLSDKYTQNNYTEDAGYYNSIVYLEAVSSVSDKALALTTATYTIVFVNNFSGYVLSVQCDPARKPDCEKLNPANKQNTNSFDFKDAQCPINLKIPMGAMKVSLSCKKFGIEVGQGVKFGYEKDFITRESTLSMGVGVDADIPGILDAKAKEKVFVKFDANNQPIDVGLSAEASIGIKGTPPIASAGYTMGMNSGFNYSGTSPF